jgi:hypothetical protein
MKQGPLQYVFSQLLRVTRSPHTYRRGSEFLGVRPCLVVDGRALWLRLWHRRGDLDRITHPNAARSRQSTVGQTQPRPCTRIIIIQTSKKKMVPYGRHA